MEPALAFLPALARTGFIFADTGLVVYASLTNTNPSTPTGSAARNVRCLIALETDIFFLVRCEDWDSVTAAKGATIPSVGGSRRRRRQAQAPT